MNGSELFEVWAPLDSTWSRWAKPVLFAEKDRLPPGQAAAPEPDLPPPAFAFDSGMAVVVDLPGSESVQTGLLLAWQGYRPVPLFNCGAHAAAVIDSRRILSLLEEGAGSLSSVGLGSEAPPAFLLDANRLRPSQPDRPREVRQPLDGLPAGLPLRELPEVARDLAHPPAAQGRAASGRPRPRPAALAGGGPRNPRPESRGARRAPKSPGREAFALPRSLLPLPCTPAPAPQQRRRLRLGHSDRYSGRDWIRVAEVSPLGAQRADRLLLFSLFSR